MNVSTRDLLDPDLPRAVSATLREAGLAARDLVLEVTEATLMADQERAMARLAELRDLGVRISIDDYGSGYASIGYISRLPMDELKVGASFVRGFGRDPHCRAVVRTPRSSGAPSASASSPRVSRTSAVRSAPAPDR